ncbi:unnamed protein product [Hymenolepis diminuta]|uniref:Uncharacterized protein n=1 Tax=Hymenolepis diminuta TaxID=6216 RepID=A0A564Z0H2_HYMDI|nr:unnamed protein product [Hymenolepis diminuta]
MFSDQASPIRFFVAIGQGCRQWALSSEISVYRSSTQKEMSSPGGHVGVFPLYVFI